MVAVGGAAELHVEPTADPDAIRGPAAPQSRAFANMR
jgi:hypothetical protein